MSPLTLPFIDSCPVEGGFRMRGLEMTRVEVFIDAAFAFAVTMLVISFDAIPQSYDEVMLAVKTIPAFIMAVAQLVWIWHTHNIWSRRFGLDTTYTVLISSSLLVVVLIYVYPMRIMAGAFFAWLSDDYFPANFSPIKLDELRDMFVFLGVGFIALCLVFVEMYRYAMTMKSSLMLSEFELFICRSYVIRWFGASIVGMILVFLALSLPSRLVPFTGFTFSLLGFWFPFATYLRLKKADTLGIKEVG